MFDSNLTVNLNGYSIFPLLYPTFTLLFAIIFYKIEKVLFMFVSNTFSAKFVVAIMIHINTILIRISTLYAYNNVVNCRGARRKP